ncbi:MAG: putative transporter transrane protein [Actinomycetia bacterium]|nr:putative transporter transrane protein [Actinomycetes bacterium]
MSIPTTAEIRPRLSDPAPIARLYAAVASEWIKLRSVRSVPIAFLATIVFAVAEAGMVCAGFAAQWTRLTAGEQASFDPTYRSIQGILFAQLVVGALGVLVISNEYGSGLIRTTFTSTPQRGLVLAAKAITFGMVAWAAGTVMSFAAFFVGQSLLSSPVPHATLGQPGVLRAVLGGGVYLMLIGLLGLALGAILRSTAAGISSLFGIVLVLPLLLDNVPTDIIGDTAVYLPSNAGEAFWAVVPQSSRTLSPEKGIGVLALEVAAAWLVAFLLIRRRDA